MHEEISRIRAKVVQSPWPKFIHSLSISNLRGWAGQEIRFGFPVTVICGENGSGKSTILKAAASLYANPQDPKLSFFPSTFFPDTPWEQAANVELSYRLQEGASTREFAIRKRSARWRFQKNRPRRNVVVLDVSRTLPIEATAGYAYIAKRTAQEVSTNSLSSELTRYYSSIMGRTYDTARFALSDVDARRSVGVVTCGSAVFSQFHQGAGEDATLDLIATLQSVPDTALVLLDEVEASLHPRSQRRLVHFLLWLARTKHIQVILTTHSPYVLEELPPDARIFVLRGSAGIEVMYGVTPSFALNRMDDINRPELYLMTEDAETSAVALALLRTDGVDVTRVCCVEVGPANTVIAVSAAARSFNFPVRAIGIVDGDQRPDRGTVRLPGEHSPERQLIQDIRNLATASLAQRLGRVQHDVESAIDLAMSHVDPHHWPGDLARSLGLSTNYLWETLCLVWSANCVAQADREAFSAQVQSMLE